MRNQEWDSALAQLHPLDLCQLVLRLFSGNAVDCETAFGIVDEAEVLACLLDRDNIHESGGIRGICADFTVYFDEALHNDCFSFAGVESILQSGSSQQGFLESDRDSLTHRLRMKTMSGIQSRSL